MTSRMGFEERQLFILSFRVVFAIPFLLFSPGCALLPAHSRSMASEKEILIVNPLSFREMTEYREHFRPFEDPDLVSLAADELRYDPDSGVWSADYETWDLETKKRIGRVRRVVPVSDDAMAGAALLGTAVGFAADYLLDWIEKELEEEVSKYEASYSQASSTVPFWRLAYDTAGQALRVQDLAGFELLRTVEVKGEQVVATRFVLAIVPVENSPEFRIHPLFFTANYSKAKILSYQGKDWWTTPFTWLLKTGSSIDVDLGLRFESIWETSAVVRRETLAEYTLKISDVDLEENTVVEFQGRDLGVLPRVPVSDQPLLIVPSTGGLLTLSIEATERDRSNAKVYLSQGQTALAENREDWVNRLQEAVQ